MICPIDIIAATYCFEDSLQFIFQGLLISSMGIFYIPFDSNFIITWPVMGHFAIAAAVLFSGYVFFSSGMRLGVSAIHAAILANVEPVLSPVFTLVILGEVNGNVDIKGKLEVSGNIKGNSSAAEVLADAARITGELKSGGAVNIGQSTVIVGNISGTAAEISGAVKGDLDIHGPVVLNSTAIVMGDIKSKSVQINSGAVIEGHCSQCYADISPTSFFDELK